MLTFLNTDDKYNNVDKDNSDNVNDDNEDKKKNLMDKLGPIGVLFNTLRNIKKLCISHVIFNSNNDTVQVIEEEGTLILYSYSDNGDQEPKYQAQYYTKDKGPHVFIQGNHELSINEERNNEGNRKLSNNKGNQKPKRRVQNRKGKKKLDKRTEPERLPEGEELAEKRSKGLHEEFPVEENPKLPEELPNLESEEFEESSLDDSESDHNNETKYHLDDKAIKLGEDLHKILCLINKLPICPPTRDKKIFPRNELYRKAIINHLMDDSEFSSSKGFRQVNNIFADDLIITDITNAISPPFVTNDEKDIRDVLRKLTGHIFSSVTGSTKSKAAKDILRRKDL